MNAATTFSRMKSIVTLLMACLLIGESNGADPLLFGAHWLRVGDGVIAVTSTDLNGDQTVDLAVVDQPNDRVVILLNTGNGVFVENAALTVGASPQSIAAADLNGDSYPDLAVANNEGNSVSVLLNLGHGAFANAAHYAAGDGAHSVAIGDVNGDDRPDLAAANFDANTVSVLINDGDGAFAAQTAYATDSRPRCAAIQDLNGDGRGDLAIACRSAFTEAPGTVAVHLNNGDGTFAPRVSYTAGLAPSAVAVGDMNGDDLADLTVLNEGTSFTDFDSQVFVYLNDGDGAFAEPVSYTSGTGGWAMTLGDLDDDGDLDVAAADAQFSEGPGVRVRILNNDGDGSLSPPLTYRGGFTPCSLALADYNGDEMLDLAIANFGQPDDHSDSGVIIILGRGDGALAVDATDSVGGAPLDGIIGDLNRDGELDLAMANRSTFTDDDVAVLFGHGDGSFASYQGYDQPRTPNSMAAGDFDGDGWIDLVSSSSSSFNIMQIMFNYGDGTYSDAIQYEINAEDPLEVEVADINSDGHLDIAVVNYGVYPNVEEGSVSIFYNNGDGSFAAEANLVVGGHPRYLALGDLNGDDRIDLAVSAEHLYVLLNNGDGTFTQPTSYNVGLSPRDVTIADLNGDDCPELVVANFGAHDIAVLFNLGAGDFAPAAFYPVDEYPKSAAAADLDGDDDVDLVVSTSYSATVLLNDGAGAFGERIDYAAGGDHQVALAGDLDHDGDLDLSMIGWNDRNVVILLNRTFAPTCLGDLDHDADVDLSDLATLLANYGMTGASYTDGDLNADGAVNLNDLAALLSVYNTTCD